MKIHEFQAKEILRRYGVVFRRLLAREGVVASWRELVRVYRRLEARGEIRGGRFVTGVSGAEYGIRGWLAKLDAPEDGRLAFDERFLTEFEAPMRPHQVRLEAGDASSDSFCYN